MPVSEILFTSLVLLLAGQRLLEVRHSVRNEIRLRAQGGIEHAPHQMPLMKLLHGGWLLAMLAEVWILRPEPLPALALCAAIVVITGQALRYAAIKTLGSRWCVRVITVPGVAPVRSGLYRHVRHPNYLGVACEIAAFPLLHSAWITSVLFSVLNAWMLFVRIRAENAALERTRTRSTDVQGREAVA